MPSSFNQGAVYALSLTQKGPKDFMKDELQAINVDKSNKASLDIQQVAP